MIVQGALTLLSTALYFLATIMALRCLMRANYVSPRAPLAPFIIKVSTPFISLLSLLVPPGKRFDFPAFIVLYALLIGDTALKGHLNGFSLPFFNLTVLSIVHAITLVSNILFFSILVRAMMSWIEPNGHPINRELLTPLTYWIESPIRRFIPPIGTLDLTPIVAILGLKLIEFVLTQPLFVLLSS